MQLLTSANARAEEMRPDRTAEGQSVVFPYQAFSMGGGMSISPSTTLLPQGEQVLRLRIDENKLARAAFEMARDAFVDANREVLTELAKW